MYQSHFGLTDEPFGVSPDQRFFFQTEQHREALATLSYAIQQRRGFALLIGAPGLGKTSVLAQLLHRLDGKAETAYLPHPYFDRANVLESILVSLGLETTPSNAQNHRTFYEWLMKTRRSGKTCVVVFDEAQNLDRETLEAIRMLSNFETPTEKLMQIVLVGQPALAEKLRHPDFEQLRQRLGAIARLEPLSATEARGYIAHRLETVGGSTRLFSPEALETIASASQGVPRNLNTMCFNALTLAFAQNHHQVGREEVAEVLLDLDLGPNLSTIPEKKVSDLETLAPVHAISPILLPKVRFRYRPALFAVLSGLLMMIACVAFRNFV